MGKTLVKGETIKLEIGNNLQITNKRVIKDDGINFQDLNLKSIESIEHKEEKRKIFFILSIAGIISIIIGIILIMDFLCIIGSAWIIICLLAFFLLKKRELKIKGTNTIITNKAKFEDIKKIREIQFKEAK